MAARHRRVIDAEGGRRRTPHLVAAGNVDLERELLADEPRRGDRRRDARAGRGARSREPACRSRWPRSRARRGGGAGAAGRAAGGAGGFAGAGAAAAGATGWRGRRRPGAAGPARLPRPWARRPARPREPPGFVRRPAPGAARARRESSTDHCRPVSARAPGPATAWRRPRRERASSRVEAPAAPAPPVPAGGAGTTTGLGGGPWASGGRGGVTTTAFFASACTTFSARPARRRLADRARPDGRRPRRRRSPPAPRDPIRSASSTRPRTGACLPSASAAGGAGRIRRRSSPPAPRSTLNLATPARSSVSPSRRMAVLTRAPLRKVPFDEARSSRRSWSEERSMRACTFETALTSALRLQATERPTVNSPTGISCTVPSASTRATRVMAVRVSGGGRGQAAQHEHEVRLPAQADDVEVQELLAHDALAVHEGAVRALEVLDPPAPAVPLDAGVLAGDAVEGKRRPRPPRRGPAPLPPGPPRSAPDGPCGCGRGSPPCWWERRGSAGAAAGAAPLAAGAGLPAAGLAGAGLAGGLARGRGFGHHGTAFGWKRWHSRQSCRASNACGTRGSCRYP